MQKAVVDSWNATDESNRVDVTETEVRNILKGARKATGPDGISNKILNVCSDQLAGPFARLFQLSLNAHNIPTLWRPTCIIPVPKISKPVVNNDYRPVVLTSNVMKCLERVVLEHLARATKALLDPHQFAYQPYRSTDESVITLLQHVCQHLDKSSLCYIMSTNTLISHHFVTSCVPTP